MEEELDCRGLACPAPVLQTKEAIEKKHPDLIKVTVDNEPAKENVSRFMAAQNYDVVVEQQGNDIYVICKRGEQPAPDTPLAREKDKDIKKIAVMVTTDRIGHGDNELGSKLMANFLKTLKEMGDELWRLIFINAGVKMCIEGSDVLPVLKELQAEGTLILVCGTCLDHFKLIEKKKVGETTNMLDVVTALQLADKVINI